MDEPPPIVLPAPPVEAGDVASADGANPVAINLPETTRGDGSIVIDLMPLVPPPAPEHCDENEPDPFNPVILVCRKTGPDPRLGADYGPTADEVLFGSAIPRARLKLSDNAEAQANTIKKDVGGFDADGGEVRVRIEF